MVLLRLSAFTSVALLATEVLALAAGTPWPARRRRSEDGLRPGVHELKDIRRWPAEPASPSGPPDG
ncbi:MAG: hypothetical protein WBV96_20030, partial [Polyangia bacterium]